jgi:16S rRNA (adenine1518-N6/adenine1519-N6)-dimethyltransferase
MPDTPNLSSPAVVSGILRRRDLRPKNRWGQNFLVDGNLLNKVVEGGELSPGDGVLEIGPGLGALTQALAARARQVLAVEIDPDLYATLTQETLVGIPNVAVVHRDFLQADLEHLVPEVLGPGRHPVVANIPYSITSPVVIRLLEHQHLFDRIVLMVQKEVADRLTGAPGTKDYGSLTLFVHLHADTRRVAKVPRTAFLPVPDVDSAIIRLDVLSEPRFPDLDTEHYLAVVHSAFRQRRKNLANALTGPPLSWTREQALTALAAADIDPNRRGETLTPEEFAQLTRLAPPCNSPQSHKDSKRSRKVRDWTQVDANPEEAGENFGQD